MSRRGNQRSKRHRDGTRRGSRYHHHHDLPRPNCPHPHKLAFDTEEQAIDVLRYTHHAERTVKPCRAYLCECGFWHWSSVPARYTTGADKPHSA